MKAMERHHRVGRYAYAVEAGSGFGRLTLWNPQGEAIGEIGFVEENRPVPNPRLATDLSHGVGFLAASHMLGLIDMLRNEPNVFMSLSDDPPGFLSIHTG
jgi:hypothetical protein